jgi:predicted N-acyltransferase
LPKQFYAAIATEFRDAVEISVVHGSGGPLAAVMSFYSGNAVLPYYGGASSEARSLHAYDLLYWSVMCRALERGARVFDFGRSRSGSFAFDYKTHWGFSPLPLRYQYYVTRGTVPNVGPDNPKYHLFIEAWKRLPLPLSVHVGPFISRQIG